MNWIVRFNIPILLTLIRLLGSPLILPLFFVYLLPFNLFWLNILLAILFAMFALTDFFDGYLARKYGLVTAMGAILDPIADKFLLYATLIALLTVGKIHFMWVILLIGREFFMMALRHLALEHNFSIPVAYIAKIKTAVQMILLIVLILNPYQSLGIYGAPAWNIVEWMLLVLGTILSILSAFYYFTFFVSQFNAKQLEVQAEDYR